jgi:hypothetical protein
MWRNRVTRGPGSYLELVQRGDEKVELFLPHGQLLLQGLANNTDKRVGTISMEFEGKHNRYTQHLQP